MKFGTYYFLQATPDRTASEIVSEEVEQMVLSERLGFDSVWLTEHHYADYGISSAPSVLLATVAARTERVKLGMAVWVLPFHNPLRLAEETATLDILSRGRLIVGLGRGNRPQEYLGHGYKELTIAAGPGGAFRMEKNALHIWPRGGFMMIALPNADGSFTCTLFWPYEGPNSFASVRSEGQLRAFFEAQFPDALPLLPDLA